MLSSGGLYVKRWGSPADGLLIVVIPTRTNKGWGTKDENPLAGNGGLPCRNYMGHNYIGHNYIGRNCIGRNYIGHNYIGHNYAGHNYTCWARWSTMP